MRDSLIEILLMLCFMVILMGTVYAKGYYDGIAHVIKDTQITQNGEILTFNLDGGEWIYILERR